MLRRSVTPCSGTARAHPLHSVHAPFRPFTADISTRRQASTPLQASKEGDGSEIDEQREKLEKLSKISGGQYLFNRVREKAELKIGRVVNRSRLEWLESEKKELIRPAPRLDDDSVLLGAPIMGLKALIQRLIFMVFEWPFSTVLRAVAYVSAKLQPSFSSEQFEMFMMSEGEQIWRWRNRTQNERWFWQFFLFRSLVPTLMGIMVYEAFVPDNILWAVCVPYFFYWLAFRVVLNPWMFDWWLVMYFGLYAKCWPGIVAIAQWLFA